jgi:hypothetical protein
MAYAVWKYDVYPYILCAKITGQFDDGRVTCEGYGTSIGYAFVPKAIVSDEVGEKLGAQIKYEQHKKREIILEFQKRGLKRIDDIFSFEQNDANDS